MDMKMPVMDGYEVCEKLKENIDYQHIPIIFLTAKSNTEDIVKGFHCGAVDYVSKPFNQEELLARVKTHIELKRLRGLLPMCASCKSICANEDGTWYSVEEYIESHSAAHFSHSVCEDCQEKLYGQEEWFQQLKRNKKK